MDDETKEPTRRDFVRMVLTYAGALPVAALVQRCVGGLSNQAGQSVASRYTRDRGPLIEPIAPRRP